jgi:hypothetical protein
LKCMWVWGSAIFNNNCLWPFLLVLACKGVRYPPGYT